MKDMNIKNVDIWKSLHHVHSQSKDWRVE